MTFIILKNNSKKFPFNYRIFFNEAKADKYIQEHCNGEIQTQSIKQEKKNVSLLGGLVTMDCEVCQKQVTI